MNNLNFQRTAQSLAYMGDAVLEVLVREFLIGKGFEKSSALNRESLKYVTAVAQNKAVENIVSLLSSEESDIFRRGKNCSHISVPKSASALEYKNATGFEAVFGYLFLNRDFDRIHFLFNKAYNIE